MRSKSFHYVFSYEKYDKQSITTITGAISKVIKRVAKAMKKIMNDVQNIVQDMLHGFYFEHNDKVNYDETNNIIYVKDIEK